MNDALAEREEAEEYHQLAMSALEKAGTQDRMLDWATAKKWIEENPIIAKIYTVSHDESGAPSYTPTVDIVNPTPPTLNPLDLSGTGRGRATGAVTSGGIEPMGGAGGSGNVNIENLNVYSPKADASTMMHETKTTFREIGSQVVI